GAGAGPRRAPAGGHPSRRATSAQRPAAPAPPAAGRLRGRAVRPCGGCVPGRRRELRAHTGDRAGAGRRVRDRDGARLRVGRGANGAGADRAPAGPPRPRPAGPRAAAEEHRSARLAQHRTLLEDSASFRPVLPVDEGTLVSGRLALTRGAPLGAATGWRAAASLEAGAFEGDAYGRPGVELELFRRSPDRHAEVRGRVAAGLAFGAPPAQRLFLIGGPNTLPGYGYRSFIGDRYALADVEASHTLIG